MDRALAILAVVVVLALTDLVAIRLLILKKLDKCEAACSYVAGCIMVLLSTMFVLTAIVGALYDRDVDGNWLKLIVFSAFVIQSALIFFMLTTTPERWTYRSRLKYFVYGVQIVLVVISVIISPTPRPGDEKLIHNMFDIAANGDLGMAERLLDLHPWLARCEDAEGMTPLHDTRSKEIAELLLQKGAYVDAQDQAGRTPLYFSVMFRRKEVTKVLVMHGANSSARANNGKTLVDLARENKDSDVLSLLHKR